MFARSFSAMCAIALVSSANSVSARDGYYNYQDEVLGRGGFALKGSFLLGGSFGFSALSTTASFVDEFDDRVEVERSNTLFGASILFGHFVADNFFLGGALGVDYQSVEDDSQETSQTTGSIDIMPRYYIQLGSAREGFFVIQGNVGYASTSTEDDDGNESGMSGFTAGLGAGIAALLGDNDDGAVVDLMVTVRHSFLETDEEPNIDVGITAFGVRLGIGTYF